MRLVVRAPSTGPVHTDTVTTLGWSSSNELFSCSDDHSIQRWTGAGEHLGQVQSRADAKP